jgi:hypothetical protein
MPALDPSTGIKRCANKNCQQTDPKSFSKDKTTGDGLQSYCKLCPRASVRASTRRRRDRGKRPVVWCSNAGCTETNPNKFGKDRTRKNGLRACCKRCKKVRDRRYRKVNPEGPVKRKIRHSKHYAIHGESIRAKRYAYRQDHPEADRAAKRRRRARTLSLPSQWTAQDWQECLAFFGHSCAYCGRGDAPLQRDHFIPLDNSRLPDDLKDLRLGTVPSNMVPACGSCNSSKCNTDPFEWLPAELPFWVHALGRITRTALDTSLRAA